MTTMLTVPSHAEVTIRRPDGQVEVVSKPGSRLTDSDFAKIRAATQAAGRGECLSYVNVSKQIETPVEWDALTAAEKAYDDSTRAIYRAMDADYEGPGRDRTPSHKSDM